MFVQIMEDRLAKCPLKNRPPRLDPGREFSPRLPTPRVGQVMGNRTEGTGNIGAEQFADGREAESILGISRQHASTGQ